LLARWRSFWGTLWRRQRFEADLDEELRFHLESRAQDLVRQGRSPTAALRQARLELGAIDGHKQEVRQARGLRLWDELVADLRFAWRGWRRQRGLALAVTAILTLGIGVAAAVFTLVNAAVLRPQMGPGGDPGSFARVYVAQAFAPALPDRFSPPQIADLLALQGAARTLADVAGARWVSARLDADPNEVKGLLVTCNFFSVHRPARPLLGRLLDHRDCGRGAPVMVLSERLWRLRGADPAVVGKALTYKGRPFTVVGVVTGKFDGVREENGVWLPYDHGALWPVAHTWESRFDTAARLRPGHSRRDAAAELNVLLQQLDGQHPGRRSRVLVTDGSIVARPSSGQGLVVLSLLFGLLAMIVLLISANVVSLLLARAHARRHEIAVRLALGAGSRRLMKMLMVETLPLAALAGALSLLLARALPPLLVRWLDDDPRDIALDPDWRVWLFVGGVSLLAALASGLTPALEALNVDLMQSLKGRLRGLAPGSDRHRWRDLLVAAQVMVTVVLLAGAALFVRAYVQIAWQDQGFDTRHTLVTPLRPRGEDPPSWPLVHQAVSAQLRATPGVEAVALATAVPPGGRYLRVARDQGSFKALSRQVQVNGVSPSFFETLRVPVLRGRALQPADAVRGSARGTVPNVVVSQRLARDLWPDGDPIGQSLRTSVGGRLQVVGVAGDVLRPGRDNDPSVYEALGDNQAVVLVRFSGDATAATARVEAAIARAAPRFATSARTFHARYQKDADQMARVALLVLVLGGCALALSLVGVYGTVSFAARRRLKEIGIRMALGATGRDLVRALVFPTARAVGLGALAGTLLALVLAPGLRPLTGELDYRDPLAHLGAALLLGVAALAAMLGPARRALAADPAAILRED
jgi:predicted permease